VTVLPARTVIAGEGKGGALVTEQPVNFTAAFTKIPNIVPWRRAEVRDRHHALFKSNIKGKVLVLPACIGSTHTGLVLLDLVRMKNGPAAIIVERADPLLVSGVLLSEVWYSRSVPVVEHDTAALAKLLKNDQPVEVSAREGGPAEIRIA
jgi:predicted aconitase with swiveling domain